MSETTPSSLHGALFFFHLVVMKSHNAWRVGDVAWLPSWIPTMHFVRGQRHFVRGGGETRLLVICDGCEIFIMGLNKSGWSRLYMAKCVWIFKLEHFVFFYVGEILSPYTYTDERVGCFFFFVCVCIPTWFLFCIAKKWNEVYVYFTCVCVSASEFKPTCI